MDNVTEFPAGDASGGKPAPKPMTVDQAKEMIDAVIKTLAKANTPFILLIPVPGEQQIPIFTNLGLDFLQLALFRALTQSGTNKMEEVPADDNAH